MKKCKYCQTEIDDKAKVCPNCKRDLRNFFEQHAVLTIILVLFIAGGVITAFNKDTIQTTVSNETKEVAQVKEPEKKYVQLEETMQGKDWEVKISEVKFGQRINPPAQNTFYNYYQVEDTNNTYLCVVLDCKNISSLELRADKVATVKAKYNNNYTYSSFSAIEDGTLGFTYTNITNIDPLTSKKVYYLAEMPKTVEDETDTPVEVELKIDNNLYYYKVR